MTMVSQSEKSFVLTHQVARRDKHAQEETWKLWANNVLLGAPKTAQTLTGHRPDSSSMEVHEQSPCFQLNPLHLTRLHLSLALYSGDELIATPLAHHLRPMIILERSLRVDGSKVTKTLQARFMKAGRLVEGRLFERGKAVIE
jgi:hypothetical protein